MTSIDQPIPAKPDNSHWTDDQWEAIAVRGSNTLVAAAAGSGKTAVLVERIIRTISDPDDPVDVDALLVATFTKAAAAEMRARIRTALEQELESRPKSEHLRRQLALIGRSSITTLHSFCLEVIQTYYPLISLNPAFRIANDTEAELMRQDVVEQLFEDAYGDHEENEVFWRLVEGFGGDRSDAALYRLVLRLYDFSRSHPWPEQWLIETAEAFEQGGSDHPMLLEWIGSIAEDVRLSLSGAVQMLSLGERLAAGPGGPAPYLDTLRTEREQAEQLIQTIEAGSWDAMAEAFQSAQFDRLKPCRGDDLDKAIQDRVKQLRSEAKEIVTDLRDELFMRSLDEYTAELRAIAPQMQTLAWLVIEFGRRYREAKEAKGLLDFADLEHYSLQILRTPDSTPERVIPSDAALDYRHRFAEILLDEYQDTNQVQEAIIDLISRPGRGNRFMVGDVKQSIYRFRLADPGLFLAKYRRYGRGNGDPGLRIDLARNFRSRQEVVDGVNYLFKQVMNEEVAEIEYDERAELVCGADYPASNNSDADTHAIEVILAERTEGADIERSGDDPADGAAESSDASLGEDTAAIGLAESAELDTAQIEARVIAAKIHRMIGADGTQPFQVYDRSIRGMRSATYRDVVILLRSTAAWAPIFVEELRMAGIPAYAELSSGYFGAVEVETILSLLKVIDNPHQDIPLAAVLRSPIFGLSADELAQIRIHGPGLTYYEAVSRIARAEADDDNAGATDDDLRWDGWSQAAAAIETVDTPMNGGAVQSGADSVCAPPYEWANKLQRFETMLGRWRDEARQGALADLIWSIYRETGYYDFVGGLPGGSQRQANLRALYDRARQYEATSFRGLFRFLRFIERMRESGGDLGAAGAIGEQEDVVRLMTIHKSKGLEFPVVFVAGLSKSFNMQDLNGSFLLHKQLGFGPKYIDTNYRISYPTLPALSIRRRLRMELLAEEMRVLYVALTRPKEKLILVGTVKQMDKTLQKWEQAMEASGWALPDDLLARARSYMDWIGPALIRHEQAHGLRRRGQIPERAYGWLHEDASRWSVRVISVDSLGQPEALMEQQAAEPDRERRIRAIAELRPLTDKLEDGYAEIRDRLSWTYPYRAAETRFAKSSVTELKRHISTDTDSDEAAAAEHPALTRTRSKQQATLHLRRPAFMEQRGLSPAERGTLYHALMQYLPLNQPLDPSAIDAVIAEMIERELILPESARELDSRRVASFFTGPLGIRLTGSSRVQREVPFSLALPAEEAYSDSDPSIQGETVLVQGVIDCIFWEEDGWVLLDYKTDAVDPGRLDQAAERYRHQLQWYARAVERIWKEPVKQAYLYFLNEGSIAEIDLT